MKPFIHRKTEFITFPRSGHNLLKNILQAYFGEAMKYCETYSQPELMFDKCQETNCQKNHDFDLQTPAHQGRNHVVQIRDPLESIESWWEMRALGGYYTDRQKFFDEGLAYWTRFISKWVLTTVPNRIIVHYRDLIDKTPETVARVITHISLPDSVDYARIESVLSCVIIAHYPGVRKSEYFR